MSYYYNEPTCTIDVAVKQNKVVGYISCCVDSEKAMDYFSEKMSYYKLFKDQYKDYPAHLHINCHPQFQGLGAGSLLIQSLIKRLRQNGSCGLHLVTDPQAANVVFYGKNGFEPVVTRSVNNYGHVMMGLKL